MINFRFHLVSLIAVFLALALGIALGATVIDRALVSGLKNQISSLDRRVAATNRTDADLRTQVTAQNNALDIMAPVAVQRLLYGRSVLVFAQRGSDSESVKRLVTLLQQAEATSPAIVWLEPKWQLRDAGARADLAAALGLDDATAASASSAELVQRAMDAIASRLPRVPETAPRGETTTTIGGAAPADVLDALRRAGFISIERTGPAGSNTLASFGGAGTGAVLVVPPTPPASATTTTTSATTPAVDLVAMFARTIPTRGTSLVVGEADSGNTDSGRLALAPIRDDRDLAARVSTVDDLDSPVGRIATALALNDLEAGRVGHYGVKGADGPLPKGS